MRKSFKIIILQRFIKLLFFHLRKQVKPALVKDQVADVLPFHAVGRNTVLFTQLPESDQKYGIFVFYFKNSSRSNVLLSDRFNRKKGSHLRKTMPGGIRQRILAGMQQKKPGKLERKR